VKIFDAKLYKVNQVCKRSMSENVINHIAIIMDGNRRFAKRLMQKPWEGHKQGAQKLQDIMNWCKEKDIKTLTVYAFSYENFNRPKDEFEFLMKLFDEEITTLIDKRDELTEKGLRVRCCGKLDMFPKELHEKMQELMELTKDNGPFTINMCLAYSGRVELVDAFTKMKEEGVEITQDSIKDYLYIPQDPEIIIRTGGEKRLSNFLTYQSVYSELFFVDALWPEFSKEEFDSIIEEFENRHRRFGK